MRDADVRAALLTSLAEFYGVSDDTRIVQEMGIWSGSVRIDVAVINGQLHGYELKSARDTLERLDAQADLYNQVFDKVTLVTAEKHFYKAEKKIPKWWGIAIAVPKKGGGVDLRHNRQPRQNRQIVPIQVARLLWRTELLDVLERHELSRGIRSGTVDAMAARVADRLSLHVLQTEVREILKRRPAWSRQSVNDQRDMAIAAIFDPLGAASG
jgi:hypothetical protein